MNRIIVFYAGLIYGEYVTQSDFRLLQTACDPELYNGGYVHYSANHPALQGAFTTDGKSVQWYRMDGTPVLLDHVPKELRLLVLLMQ